MTEKTGFHKFTNPELEAIAEQFAVEIKPQTKKADIIKALETDGVTYELYESLRVEPEEDAAVEAPEFAEAPLVLEDAEPVEEEPEQIVKMTRKNWTYEIRGYRFTQQHPYALVKEDDADYLIEVDGGFRPATPKEIREFYGA